MRFPALLSRCALGAALLAAALAARAAPSSDPEMPGEVLVKLRTTNALAPLLGKFPLALVDRFGARPIYRLQVVGGARTKDVVAALALEPDVLIAETNPTQRSPEARKNVVWTIGSAQAFAAQWAPQAIRLADAQRIASGSGVRVAVLDTGIDLTHPLFAGRLDAGFDFVDADGDPSEGAPTGAAYGHGTHVAGLVAMAAPKARIVPYRVLDADGFGNAWVLGEAMLHAIDPDGNPATDDGAHVINLSLGGLARTRIVEAVTNLVACNPAVPGDPVDDRSDPGYNDDAARCAAGHAAVVVAAAGNDASVAVKQYPAAEGAYGLLPVAASRADHRLAAFSNYGSWIDLATPGDLVTSAVPGGWGTWSGTSMAAPIASGVAALVRSIDPFSTPKDVVRRLVRSGAALCGTTQIRQLDAVAALNGGTPAPLACP